MDESENTLNIPEDQFPLPQSYKRILIKSIVRKKYITTFVL